MRILRVALYARGAVTLAAGILLVAICLPAPIVHGVLATLWSKVAARQVNDLAGC